MSSSEPGRCASRYPGERRRYSRGSERRPRAPDPIIRGLSCDAFDRRVCIDVPSTLEKGTDLNGETSPGLLADLEHELRLSRNTVRMGIAACEYERHLHVSWRRRGSNTASVACRSDDRATCSTHHWFNERSYLEPIRSSPTLLSHWCNSVKRGSVLYARFNRAMDRSKHA